MSQQPDPPLTSVEDVRKEVGRLETPGVLDELLVAILENQHHFYDLHDEIADLVAQSGQGDVGATLDEIRNLLANVDQGVGQLQQAVAALEGAGPRDDWNYTVEKFDLDKKDWVLSSEEDTIPDVQGSEEVAIFVESQDDEAFDVEFRFVNAEGVTVTRVDSDIDSELSSTSPTGANHHVFVTVATANRYADVAFTDTSGNKNRIDATINFH